MPLEERKYKDMNQFGEGEQAKICLEIMQRTGAHLELSLAKDQGLSIMVSGKLDAVMKARKDIVARLQTQVGPQLILLSRCALDRAAGSCRYGFGFVRPFPHWGGNMWSLLAFLFEKPLNRE